MGQGSRTMRWSLGMVVVAAGIVAAKGAGADPQLVISQLTSPQLYRLSPDLENPEIVTMQLLIEADEAAPGMRLNLNVTQVLPVGWTFGGWVNSTDYRGLRTDTLLNDRVNVSYTLTNALVEEDTRFPIFMSFLALAPVALDAVEGCNDPVLHPCTEQGIWPPDPLANPSNALLPGCLDECQSFSLDYAWEIEAGEATYTGTDSLLRNMLRYDDALNTDGPGVRPTLQRTGVFEYEPLSESATLIDYLVELQDGDSPRLNAGSFYFEDFQLEEITGPTPEEDDFYIVNFDDAVAPEDQAVQIVVSPQTDGILAFRGQFTHVNNNEAGEIIDLSKPLGWRDARYLTGPVFQYIEPVSLPVRVERSANPEAFIPGPEGCALLEITVTATPEGIRDGESPGTLVLEDALPEGWIFIDSDPEITLVQGSPDIIQAEFEGFTLDGERRAAAYRVRVPLEAAGPATLQLANAVLPVAGRINDHPLEISPAPAPAVTITRQVPADFLPGETVTILLHVAAENPAGICDFLLTELVPADWPLVSQDSALPFDNSTPGQLVWELSPADFPVTIEYVLNVPFEHPIELNAQFDGGAVAANEPFTIITPALPDTISGRSYLLEYTAGEHGSIAGITPQTVFHGMDGETVTAVPDTGYAFLQWSDAVVSAERREENVTAAISVAASFAINLYPVTYAAGSGGSISGNAIQSVPHGENAAPVTAVASEGYRFVQWSDGMLTQMRQDLDLQGPLSVTALFELIPYEVNYLAGPNGSIAGAASQIVLHGQNGSEVVAEPAEGYRFVQWSDGNTDAARTDANVTADLTVTAFFAIREYTLTYAAGTGGQLIGNTEQLVEHGNDGTPVTAQPDSGYRFVQWSDERTEQVRIDANVVADLSVTAEFERITYALTYLAGENGSLTGETEQVVNQGEDGSAVTAVPDEHYHFVRWSDDRTDPVRIDLNVQADVEVTALFEIDRFSLTYVAGENGTIAGESLQLEIPYGGSGSQVTALPAEGFQFVTWSDGILNPSRTDASVTEDLTVTATFERKSYTVTYVAAPNGSISGAAVQTVLHGDSTTPVTAVPDDGYRFLQWSDGRLAESREETNVTANRSYAALFDVEEGTEGEAEGEGEGEGEGEPTAPCTLNGSTQVPLIVPDQGLVTSSLTIDDSLSIVDLNVTLRILQFGDEDLTVTLGAPGGIEVELFSGVGGTGEHFLSTVLDDEAESSIATGAAPFTGRFRPQASLSAFDGADAQGEWILTVSRPTIREFPGVLVAWGLEICVEPAEEGEGETAFSHTADWNNDGRIDLSELLRVIQLFNSGQFHCDAANVEDGYSLGLGDTSCTPHAADYEAPPNFRISLSELLRVIQIFNIGGYYRCSDPLSDDGYCAGPPPEASRASAIAIP